VIDDAHHARSSLLEARQSEAWRHNGPRDEEAALRRETAVTQRRETAVTQRRERDTVARRAQNLAELTRTPHLAQHQPSLVGGEWDAASDPLLEAALTADHRAATVRRPVATLRHVRVRAEPQDRPGLYRHSETSEGQFLRAQQEAEEARRRLLRARESRLEAHAGRERRDGRAAASVLMQVATENFTRMREGQWATDEQTWPRSIAESRGPGNAMQQQVEVLRLDDRAMAAPITQIPVQVEEQRRGPSPEEFSRVAEGQQHPEARGGDTDVEMTSSDGSANSVGEGDITGQGPGRV
jgi:hypothetical protein